MGLGNYNVGTFYCDCGAGELGNDCQNAPVQYLNKLSKGEFQLSDSSVDYQMTKSVVELQPCAIISPTNNKMALELAGNIFGCTDLVEPFIKTKYTEVPSDELFVACGVFGLSENVSLTDLPFNFNYKATKENGKELVNKFVEDETNGMIKNLLDQEPVGTTLVSTLYFKGSWEDPFDDYQTSKSHTFKGLNGEVPVEMMRKFGENKSKFIRTSNLKSIVLPYQGGRFVAILTLPNENKQSIHTQFKSDSMYNEWQEHLVLKGMKEKRVMRFVPKFKKEFDYRNMEQILEKSGFDFSSFRKRSGIDQVIHKVVVEFDEKGTEASAATGLVSKGMPSYDDEWIGDRPYLLAITDLVDRSVLFSGIMDFST